MDLSNKDLVLYVTSEQNINILQNIHLRSVSNMWAAIIYEFRVDSEVSTEVGCSFDIQYK